MLALAAGLPLSSSSSVAQIRDQLIVYTYAPPRQPFEQLVMRFSRSLVLLGSTNVHPPGGGSVIFQKAPISPHPSGDLWIASEPKVLRLGSDGLPLPETLLSPYDPVEVKTSLGGYGYVLTRVGIDGTGPLFALDSAGTTLWSNAAGPALYPTTYPDYLTFRPNGELWIGGFTKGTCGCQAFSSLLTQVHAANGGLLGVVPLPVQIPPPNGTYLLHFAAAPDGTLWSLTSGTTKAHLVATDGASILQDFVVEGGANGETTQMRIDAEGHAWTVGSNTMPTHVLRHSTIDGTPLADYDLVGIVAGFAIGATGEELFAVVGIVQFPVLPRRLVRLNLVTGVKSSLQLDPPHYSSVIPDGDPTGFIYANVTDQSGDNDGDGSANRAETAAGSSPYDALSRPDGPKAYLSFAAANRSIILRIRDPDGLLHPAKGLDTASLSLKAGAYGEIFPLLVPFLSALELAPDGKEVTLRFGLLPIPLNAKVPLEARIRDKTGAEGWDWQVTPPGDL